MKKIFKSVVGVEVLNGEHFVSPLQMSLTLLTTICLILSNIIVVKPIDLFGISSLPNTCALLVFPVTYILSDVFSEVYGYRWSRLTATWAFLGTIICSILFALTIALPGNASWTNQEALVSILGYTPKIAFASVLAFWFGDWANDKAFVLIKKALPNDKAFFVRAIGSSLFGKYVDGAIFTFIGLSHLPMSVKLAMVATCPFVQICLETILFPVTNLVKNKVQKVEDRYATKSDE